ncbi:hypothetical protein KI387_025234 [Taxus chinensis]|uniref:Integrase catalytic domain-containing protein n=1 Tax=Taxus chinensis TaxID=29808 RepID=A0AA38G5Z0_TAXCH|nr:hypothetical protein KI387_025234 [Taxus chinensis]
MLDDMFGKQDDMRVHELENELLGLNPSDFENLQAFFSKFVHTRLLLKECKVEKKDSQLILSILSKLGPEYSVFISTFHAMKATLGSAWKMPSFDSFSSQLIREQDKLIQMGTLKSKSHALVANKGKKNEKKKETKDQPKKETKTNQPPAKPNTNTSTSEPKVKKEKFKCSYCKNSGHDEHHCFWKQIDHLTHLLEKNKISVPESVKQNAQKGESSKAKESKNEKKKGKALVARSAPSSTWIIDSGASHHMASSEVEFSSIEPCGMSQIMLGDDTHVSVSGSGSVEIEGGTFNQVLSVPNLSTNLLSVYQITHLGEGMRVEFGPNSVIIRELNSDCTVAEGKVDHHSRLYTFSHFSSDLMPNALLTHANEVSKLWHEHFGHLNYRYLEQLSQNEMVNGLPRVKFSKGLCEGCTLGKHPKKNFDKGKSWRATRPLDLVHSDVSGPFPSPSFTRALYILTFIDEFSRYTWVYFLKLKSEVFEHFQNFKALAEKQVERSIKVLRTDNGGEYVSNRFEDFYTSEGIALQRTVAYNPSQNGVAERKNRTLKEMATCMVHSKSLPPQYWAEAVNCACYIQNHVPHKQVRGMTPFEAWFGHKPDVEHF